MKDIWYGNGQIKQEIVESKNLLLNGVYDIYCDMYQGRFEKIPLLFEIFSGNRAIMARDDLQEELDNRGITIEFFKIMRHVLMILMQMLDSEEKNGSDFRINFQLYAFELPVGIKL